MNRITTFLPVAPLALATICSASNLAVNLGLGFTNNPDEPGFQNVTVSNNVNGPLNGLATINGVTLSLDEGGTLAEEIRSIDRGDPGAYSGPLGALTNTWVGTENPGTSLRIILSGVTAGAHQWTSYHMDESNQTGNLIATVSVDGGATFAQAGGGTVDIWDTGSHNGTGTAPASADQFAFSFQFTANGSDDVIIELAPAPGAGGGTDFTVTNGFEVIELDDDDADLLPDGWELTHVATLAELTGLSNGPGPGSGTGDFDGDGLSDAGEFDNSTDPTNSDTDADGLSDGAEVHTHGSNPLDGDSDGDGIGDSEEVVAGADGFVTNPSSADTDGDHADDPDEIAIGTNPVNALSFPRVPGLAIDFTPAGADPNVELFYQPYLAAHETNSNDPYGATPIANGAANGVDRTGEPYLAFGTTVSLGIRYPNLDRVAFPDEVGLQTVKQALDRDVGNYLGARPNLMRNWLGTDARFAQGGNGADDGSNEPTILSVQVNDLPDGTYRWRSYHHDTTGNQFGRFAARLSDANGSGVLLSDRFRMTTSTAPNSDDPGAGNGPESLRSTIEFLFTISGGSRLLQVDFEKFEVLDAAFTSITAESFFAINGFEIEAVTDSDGDGIADDTEIAAFGAIGVTDGSGDQDGDGLDDAAELLLNSDPHDPDTDGDGVSDGDEAALGTDVHRTDSDRDGYNDGREVAAGTDAADASDHPLPPAGALFVDFNSNQDNGGDSATSAEPSLSAAGHNQAGYQSYHANHEVAAEFSTANYSAFGTNVTLLPTWPDTTANTVMQSIDRADQDAAGLVLGGNDANWRGDQINLLTDWLGTDARTASGGNGIFSGLGGIPTSLWLTIGNLPSGSYAWRSYHHDTEHMHTPFVIEVSTDGGATFRPAGGARQGTDSTAGGTPASATTYDGAADFDPAALPSTFETCFVANGVDDVVVRGTPYATDQVHLAFFVINGFELTELPNDSDDDCLDDTAEVMAFGDLSQGAFDDFDGDGLDNLAEIDRGTDPTLADSDGDGLDDGDEISIWLTDPLAADTDGDGLSDGDEVNTHNTNPTNSDTDFDLLTDGEELAAGTNPLDFDTDNDGMDDGCEVNYGLDPFNDDANEDPDGDGLLNIDECFALTDPFNDDTDGDGLNDGDEWLVWFTDPLNTDSDGDGLADGAEVNTHGSDPFSVDTDFDGDADGKEVLAGSDPNDDTSRADTDGDGYSNSREIAAGSDPNNAASYPLPPAGALFVDFNSNLDEGGDSSTSADPAASAANHNQLGYQSYHANQETRSELTSASYTAFGTTVTFTPSWPDTIADAVAQSYDRTDQDAAGLVLGGSDATWHGDQINLLTDWIGTDARTGSGGNGNYDGVSGVPTTLLFTFSGLPAGEYEWRSYHHDTELVHSRLRMDISTDGGATFGSPIETHITNGSMSANQNPAAAEFYNGAANPGSLDPADLPSTINTSFTANGTQNVVVRFVPLAEVAVHHQFAVVNAFELAVAASGIVLTDVSFVGGELEVTGEGFTTGTQYVLRRSTDGQNWTDVNPPFVATGNTRIETDASPLPMSQFPAVLYQFWTP